MISDAILRSFINRQSRNVLTKNPLSLSSRSRIEPCLHVPSFLQQVCLSVAGVLQRGGPIKILATGECYSYIPGTVRRLITEKVGACGSTRQQRELWHAVTVYCDVDDYYANFLC